MLLKVLIHEQALWIEIIPQLDEVDESRKRPLKIFGSALVFLMVRETKVRLMSSDRGHTCRSLTLAQWGLAWYSRQKCSKARQYSARSTS